VVEQGKQAGWGPTVTGVVMSLGSRRVEDRTLALRSSINYHFQPTNLAFSIFLHIYNLATRVVFIETSNSPNLQPHSSFPTRVPKSLALFRSPFPDFTALASSSSTSSGSSSGLETSQTALNNSAVLHSETQKSKHNLIIPQKASDRAVTCYCLNRRLRSFDTR